MNTQPPHARRLPAHHPMVERRFNVPCSTKIPAVFRRKIFSVALFFTFLAISPAVVAQVTHLYLSDPSQALDRNDPVATADNTTASSYTVYGSAPGVLIDAVSTRVSLTGPVTLSHTTGTENNRLMLVGISQRNRLVSSVTYGGVPLTLVGENNSNANARIAIYRLVNPAPGTANVVVNFSANPVWGAVVSVTTFYNVDQSNPLGTFATAQANSSTPSVNVSSAAGELVYDVVSKRNQSISVGAGQTQRWNLFSGSEIYGGGSTEPGAASTTMSWTAGSSDWAMGAVSIKPAPVFNTISFLQSPVLCSDMTITTTGNITVSAYLGNVTGTMPANPAVTAELKYNNNSVITLSNPVYNNGTGLLTWTGTLGTNATVPDASALELVITNSQSATSFKVQYDSQTKPSKISLPVSTYINVNSVDVYSAAYPGGSIITSAVAGTTRYIRAVVSNPFGFTDITGLDFTITPTGSVVAGTLVASSGCTRTYQYTWILPGTTTDYTILATGKQGYENNLTHSASTVFSACVACPPVAVNDIDTAKGGTFTLVDVLANDYDPNNNLQASTLSILTQPHNGTGYLSNNKIIYMPNGSFSGGDTITYRVCDSTGLCDTARIFLTVTLSVFDPCADATTSHLYYLPYSENEARIALDSSTNVALASNNIRTVISLRAPYAGTTITWDQWEDGYEANILSPAQSTTLVWGDGNPYNGIVPGYPNDLIPGNGSIVLDNTIPTNPRVPANLFYDGRDKIYSSGQIAVTQVCGEPSIIGLQCMKTNVSSTVDYGLSFTIPVGQNFNSQDFRYSSLFIRAKENNTVINIDKDNNGTLETTATINEGEIYLVNGGVMSGATITASAPIGCDLHFGGNDNYSSRDVPIFPASWYSHTYYSPVPTTGAATNPADTAVVMLYNSLNRSLSINWSSGIPSSGTISIPAKSVVRFPLAMSATAGYKFVNPTGESFTAIEIVDSYTPGGGGNSGSTYDWSFNLIAESRLSDFSTIAWAPGSTDGTRNDNPIWVTPAGNTTIYVKYDGNVVSGGSVSPCGFRYDVSYTLNALNHRRLLDPNDNDQGGLAVFTCDGTKLAAVYGEDPSTATAANPSWDVGSTLQPFCKGKLVFANDDYAPTLVNQPVTIAVLTNDYGFQATIDPTTVTNIGLLQPKYGTVSINSNGTILYTPNPGYTGNDTLEYRVCSTPSPVACDIARVIIRITTCSAGSNDNILSGQVFVDINKDGVNNDGGTGFVGGKVLLYTDGNCNGNGSQNELTDSVTVDASGYYQFIKNPEKIVLDDFEGTGGARSCANGTDGNTDWATNWVDAGDPSTGFCNISQSNSNTDAEIMKDGSFSFGLRLKDNNVSATRTVNLSGASKAFLTFDYRKKSALAAGEDVLVQASSNGAAFTTIFTIAGNATTDASYVTVYNQDLISYASATTFIRFLTNNSVDDADTVYIDNVKIQFLKFSQCYVTKLDPSCVPANQYVSTVSQRATTFNSGGTCTSQMDYGLAKTSITISGSLRNDNNGLTDNQVNGAPIGAPSGITVYAYLVDSTGRIAAKTTVNASNGQFSFPTADVNTNYTLKLSTSDSAYRSVAPATFGLSATWIPMGEEYGSNNGAGAGIESGLPDMSVPIRTSASHVNNVNLSIQRLPDSDNYNTAITHPYINQLITLNGGVNPPVLSGLDPEDCTSGCLLTTRDVIFDTVPVNAELYYNNVLVTDGQTISNFNPSLLQIKVTDATIGDTLITFRYSFVDEAAKKDPSPALYELLWSWPLPAEGLEARAELQGDVALIRWSTISEHNTDYFILERSVDNTHFTATGSTVDAAGNSEMQRGYQQADDISHLFQYPVIYYRIKLVDLDGSYKYSNVVAVRLTKSIGITGWPNPFTTYITLNIAASQRTTLLIRLNDIAGRTILTKTQPAARGVSQVTLSGLGKLAKGVYLIEVADQVSGNKSIFKFIKEE
jgi:hypothetical protein